LPRRELTLAERVLPADVIPVVDVERKRHHLVGPEALREERGEPVVGGRAGVAALRRIQLDERGGVRPAVGGARGLRGVRRARGGEGAQGEDGYGSHVCTVAGNAFFLTFPAGANGDAKSGRLRPSGTRGAQPCTKSPSGWGSSYSWASVSCTSSTDTR